MASGPTPALAWSLEALERDSDVAFFTAGGPGGQHRNKSETAVRVRHRPTGVVAAARERRSQAQNRAAAFARLREKLRRMLERPPKRVPTRLPAAAKRRRVESKRRQAEKKRRRGRVDET